MSVALAAFYANFQTMLIKVDLVSYSMNDC